MHMFIVNVSLHFILFRQCLHLISKGNHVIVSQGLRLLGILDVKNIPCARDAILHGAGGSLAIGLLHFLSTSESYSPEMFVCASKTCVVVLWVSVSSSWSLEMFVFYPQVESGGLLMWDLQALCWQHLDHGRSYVAWRPPVFRSKSSNENKFIHQIDFYKKLSDSCPVAFLTVPATCLLLQVLL